MKKYILLIMMTAFFPAWGMEKDWMTQSTIFQPGQPQPSSKATSKRKICSKLQSNVKNLDKEENRENFIDLLYELQRNNKNIFKNPKVPTNTFKNNQINNLIDLIKKPFNQSIIPTIHTQLQEICQKTEISFNNISRKTLSELDALLTIKNENGKNELIEEIKQNMHLMMDFMDMQGSKARIEKLLNVLSKILYAREDNTILTPKNINTWKTSILAASAISLEKKSLETSEIALPLKEKEIEEDLEKNIRKQAPKTLRSRSYSTAALKYPKIPMTSKTRTPKEYESVSNLETMHKHNKFATIVTRLNTMGIFDVLYDQKNQFIQDIISLASNLNEANENDKNQLNALANHPLFKEQDLLKARYNILIQDMNQEEKEQFTRAWDTIVDYIHPQQISEEFKEEQPSFPIQTTTEQEKLEQQRLKEEQEKEAQKELAEKLALRQQKLKEEKERQEEEEMQRRIDEATRFTKEHQQARLKEYQEELGRKNSELNRRNQQKSNTQRWIPTWITSGFTQIRQNIANFFSPITSTFATLWSWLTGK